LSQSAAFNAQWSTLVSTLQIVGLDGALRHPKLRRSSRETSAIQRNISAELVAPLHTAPITSLKHRCQWILTLDLSVIRNGLKLLTAAQPGQASQERELIGADS
jgi:hypothetical protein